MSTGTKRMDFSRFPRRFVPKDEALFFEDDDSRELYVLLTGTLGIYRDEVQVAQIQETLSVVGEISALTRRPRNATVRALEPTTVLMVEDPDSLFEEYPQLGAKLARLLAERLAEMNCKFVELKGVVSRGLAARSATPATPEALARMFAETLPPGALRVSSPGAPPPPPASSSLEPPPPVPVEAERDELDEVMGAIADLIDFDPSLGALT
jgi:hypothetical protein